MAVKFHAYYVQMFSQEILSRLLNNEPEINEQRETIRNEIEKRNAATNPLPNGTAALQADIDDDTSQDSQESKENVGIFCNIYEILHNVTQLKAGCATKQGTKSIID